MKIQLFKNNKGLIFGSDQKRINCDIGGELKIGSTKITVSAGVENVMPILFNGSSGEYKAIFTSDIGNVYELEKVSIKGGRILPPSKIAVELMELRSRVEYLEDRCAKMEEDIIRLDGIFDTNSLNFIIKGE